MAVVNGVMGSGALSDPGSLLEGVPEISLSGQSATPQPAPPNSLLPIMSAGIQSDAWLNLVLPPFDAQCFMTGEGMLGLVNTALATQVVPAQFQTIVENFDTIISSYYTNGCTTEQLMAWLPAVIDSIASGAPLGIGTVYSSTGTTRSGETVGFTSGPPGSPSIASCTASSIGFFLPLLS